MDKNIPKGLQLISEVASQLKNFGNRKVEMLSVRILDSKGARICDFPLEVFLDVMACDTSQCTILSENGDVEWANLTDASKVEVLG